MIDWRPGSRRGAGGGERECAAGRRGRAGLEKRLQLCLRGLSRSGRLRGGRSGGRVAREERLQALLAGVRGCGGVEGRGDADAGDSQRLLRVVFDLQ